jgi:CDGSH-type Zn-finger protein
MTDDRHAWLIHIRENAAYEVRGGVPIARTAQVETEYGEPVDWAPLEPIETGEPPVLLCRCGRSATKPFCDDTCDGLEWDGTEVADLRPRAARAEVFPGDGIVITDDITLCTQAGYCGDRFRKVWDMLEDSDDPEIRARIRRMVELCPSGRIAHAAGIGAEEVEPVLEPGIGVIRDGPYWVRGGIQVESSDGEEYEVRNRVTLCRCGHSGNKPFCDGTHKVVGFREG